MEAEDDRSIVLFHYQNSCKYALFSQKKGRIYGITLGQQICVGSVITYHSVARNVNMFLMQNIRLHTMPLEWGRQDLLFFHHVLEICYHFVPIGSGESDGLFELLEFLYTVSNEVWCASIKKIFLIKLMVLIGHYPDVPLYDHNWLDVWRTISLDNLVEIKITSKQEQRINQWLRACITEHPQIMLFKTIRFLTE